MPRVDGGRAVKSDKSWQYIAALLCCLPIGTSTVAARETHLPVAAGNSDGGTTFDLAVSELTSNEIQIFNGTSPASGDWSTILVASLPSLDTSSADRRDGTCTAVQVGRHVFLTAAHCVHRRPGRTPDPIRLRIGSSWDLKFACSVDAVYASEFHTEVPRHEADYALCAIDPLARRPEILESSAPETIDLDGVSPGDQLLGAGYGCISWSIDPATGRVEYGPVKRVLAVGDFKVAEAAASADAFFSLADAAGQSALCAGDSGGPAFRGPTVAQLGAPRRITGVASYVEPRTHIVRSRFASLGSARFKIFLACWLYKNPNSGLQLKQPSNGAPVVAKPC